VDRVEQLGPEVGHIILKLGRRDLHIVDPIISSSQTALKIINGGGLFFVLVPQPRKLDLEKLVLTLLLGDESLKII
jgi:hypothetical protein